MVVGPLKRQHLFSKIRSYHIFVFIMHFVSPRVPTNLQLSLLHAFHKGDNLHLTPSVPVLFGKEPYNLGRSHKNAAKKHSQQLWFQSGHAGLTIICLLTQSNSLRRSEAYAQRNIVFLVILLYIWRGRSHLWLFRLIHYLLFFLNSCDSVLRNKNKS